LSQYATKNFNNKFSFIVYHYLTSEVSSLIIICPQKDLFSNFIINFHIFFCKAVISWHIQIWKNIELRFSKEIIFIYISFVHFRYVLTNSYQPYITLSGGSRLLWNKCKKSIITSQYNKKNKIITNISHKKK
jgi:hypothetical protein